MDQVEFDGRHFEVVHVVDPEVAVVWLDGALQGCAQILRGSLVANVSADGSASVSARTVAQVAARSGFGVGFPIS